MNEDGTPKDLVQVWNRNDKGKAARALTQLYGYMSFNHLAYGVLSTFDFTWFVHRVFTSDGGEIEISRAVPRTELLPTLAAFLLMTKKKALYASPTVSPILGAISPFSDENLYKLTALLPHQFLFLRPVSGSSLGNDVVVGWTRCGSVLRGRLAGSDKLYAFKTIDITKGKGLHEEMDKEVNIYERLGALQGKVVPRFIGYADFNGLFRALV